jgi:hypothetical protein
MVDRSWYRIGWFVILSPVVASPARSGDELVFVDDFETSDSCAWGVGPPTCPGFSITTPPLLVAPGEERYFCYFVRTGNGATQGVRRVTSSMESATLYVSLFTTHDALGNPVDLQPPGTLNSSCTWFGPDQNSRRIYTARGLEEELRLPSDDGAGDPLALEFLASQPAVLVAHVVNETVEPLTTAVSLTAYAHLPGVSYTKTATLTTVDTQLAIPIGISSFSRTCPVPPAVRFWWFSTHTHRHAQSASVQNDGSDIVVSTNWAAPEVAAFDPPAFYEFGAGEQLTTACHYLNDSGGPILFGQSHLSDETCVGLAYYFPANVPRYCINGALQP